MTAYRIPHARLTLIVLAAILLAACGEAPDATAARTPIELERDLRLMSQELEKAHSALAAAEQHNAALAEERTQDQRRLAELTMSEARLTKANQTLGRHLAGARQQAARSQSLNRALRRQNDQNLRRLHELGEERRVLRSNLSRAYADIRRLRSGAPAGQLRTADGRLRAAAREVEELRRYNGFLLRERGNLQAWLEEANATRRRQQEALEGSRREADRVKTARSEADAANEKLRHELERSRQLLAAAEKSRAALESEIEPLRAASHRATESERVRGEQLQSALARSSSPAKAHGGSSKTLDSSGAASDRLPQGADMAAGDAAVLAAELDATREKLERLRVARDYLVEKIEACNARPRPARGHPLPPPADLVQVVDGLQAQFARSRLTMAEWRDGGPAAARLRQAWLIPVASESDETAKSSRHEKELRETEAKLEALTKNHEALQSELEASQKELQALKKQVQTLTWANEVLVKELDAAYDTKQAGVPGSLPEGTRGVYVLRQGESLSRVAKAFYGDAARWTDIVEANRAKIPDPDHVEAGTIILIPE